MGVQIEGKRALRGGDKKGGTKKEGMAGSWAEKGCGRGHWEEEHDLDGKGEV